MIASNNNCSGCGVCVDACPMGCIKMVEGDDSFNYPVIDETICVGCNNCERVCPINRSHLSKASEVRVGVLKDEKVAYGSASGGAFWAIAEILVNKGFSCFGARYDGGFNVIHDSADTLEGCSAFRKSKYVISDAVGCYKKVKSMLSNGGKVFFSGTPCQVAGLRNFTGQHKNLFCVDIICHGVTSQKVFNAEIKYLEKRYSSQVRTYTFKPKNKRYGEVNTRRCHIVLENGREMVKDKFNDPFLRGYYSRLFYRRSCGCCRFAIIERGGDITIGDAWDVETVYPQYSSNAGVSLILFNTDKGKGLLVEMERLMELHSVDVDWAVKNNEQLRNVTSMHKSRDEFFKLFLLGQPFDKLVYRLAPIKAIDKLKHTAKKYLKGFLR